MLKRAICLFLLCFSFFEIKAQTTDLSIVVEAQNISGASISQVNIYQEFQYLVTILNSGDAVNDATFSQTLNNNITYFSSASQNNLGGASSVTDLNYIGNILTGTIANMPSNSSVEVLVIVRAPLNAGGIATNVTVMSPEGTTDVNTVNNQSIISIDVSDLPIDFSVVHSQVSPPEGTAISMWNDTVTYQMTITNNSTIAFPLDSFESSLTYNQSPNNGQPIVEFVSLICIGGTGGIACPDTSSILPTTQVITTNTDIFLFGDSIEFPAGASLSFEFVYRYLEPQCGIDIIPLDVSSFITIAIEHLNESPNISNIVNTQLLEATVCPLTDLCIDTVQVNPIPSQLINWNEEVTFVTTLCNNGPNDGFGRFFLQNLSVNIDWSIISLTCDSTTGSINCSDFTLSDSGSFWTTNNFLVPANTTITITTVVIFLEPTTCSTGTPTNSAGHVRSGANLLSTDVLESNIGNNFDSDFQILPPLSMCEMEDIADLSITKTQISPALPEGATPTNTAEWGSITYEIVASNLSENDTQIEIIDFMPNGSNVLTSGTLLSVDCVATTGTATCLSITNANIGLLLDGEPEAGQEDVFWSILPEDNYILPALSSITFHVVVDWFPECSSIPIRSTNSISIRSLTLTDNNGINNIALSDTYFAQCVDLVVQTYPEFTQVNVNENFNWIVDITNSNTSSNAVNIDFQDTLGSEFIVNGTPTCTVVNGNASCVLPIVSGNVITGNIVSMDAASTIQITIPVTAPGFGGAFTNNAQAIPNANDNEELTPETNISISNVQVIAPTVIKSFTPNTIIVGQQSVLEFTVTNLIGNPAQSDINFIDNLPVGVVLAGPINWVEQNGCTAAFNGDIGDFAVMVSNLTFPNGVASCTFSVPVTSNSIGTYLNSSTNFSNVNNIDISMASATLNVLVDSSNVDIEVLKAVNFNDVSIGDTVTFNISATNVGTTLATNIVLYESLPNGYNYLSSITSSGSYDVSSFLWNLASLNPGQSETLEITAQVISSNNLLNTATLQSVNEIDRDDTNNEDYAEVFVNDCLQIPQGFSPNNDGENDVFIIPCIEDYSENNIKIYNRYGSLVFEANNYKNDWNGMPNKGTLSQNKILPIGTYYYVFTINEIEKSFVSWLYLNL